MTNFNAKTIPVSLLVLISVIAPTLAFGASYGRVTNNQVGAIETMVATAWTGVAYSLVGGMPLCIIGSTGPVLALAAAIVNIADGLGVSYLTLNAWINIWLFAYTVIAGVFDITRYVKLATRFTDEIFALLIVTIFVLDAVGDPFSTDGIFRYLAASHPSHGDFEEEEDYSYLASGFLSVLIGLGTTWFIFFLRGFKQSTFLCNQGMRNLIFDFSVSGSVLFMTLLKNLAFPTVQLETLVVPDRFEPSFSCCDSSCTTYFPDDCPEQESRAGVRSWMVDLSNLNGKAWIPLFAALPALLAFLLCYLDNGITWHLINHKSHKLGHGEAYNYDLVLNGLFNCINGLLGFPTLVASTVPCIVHLHALADKSKDGKIISVHETRLTMFVSHLLLGASIFFLDGLKMIPRPVLKGVFLFMGLSALPNIQFWSRFLNFFRQPSMYPKTAYNQLVSTPRVHMFTVLQMLFFAGVFSVQNIKTIAIVFPFMTLLCIPGRLYLLPRFFNGWELALLDSNDDDEVAAVVEAKEALARAGLTERTETQQVEVDFYEETAKRGNSFNDEDTV